MSQKYRIYINEKVILIAESKPHHSENFQQVKFQDIDFTAIYHEVANQHHQKFYIVDKTPKLLFKKLVRSVKLIEAAGGLVRNSNGERLFIYRNDKWDIPKGKLEKGEKPREGGVREVEEECGITIGKAGKKICKTYHAYLSKGEVVLKLTHWYKMKYNGQEKLKPQLDEGITEVRWFKKKEVGEIVINTFPSILEVMDKTDLLIEKPATLWG
jgi:8-oxo-dGTP pyrophosphatase MutT (NUDIX family)